MKLRRARKILDGQRIIDYRRSTIDAALSRAWRAREPVWYPKRFWASLMPCLLENSG